jgi:hypothetical protein
MVINEYAHLDSERLRGLVGHLTRSEQDTQERLAAREKQAPKARVNKPDPIRKRLFFLLLKQRTRLRAAEDALATREQADGARSFFSKGHATATSSLKHPVSAENPRNARPAFYSTISMPPVFETESSRAQDAPAPVDRRRRESRIRDLLARLREACIVVLAMRMRHPRFALPR